MWCIVHLVFIGYETWDDDSTWTAWYKPEVQVNGPFVDFDAAVAVLQEEFERPWIEQGFHEWNSGVKGLGEDDPTTFDGKEIRYEISDMHRELVRIVELG